MEKGITVGLDMGDKNHSVCVLDASGGVIKQTVISNTSAAIEKFFKPYEAVLIAMEAGTHSAWICRILEKLGHTVLVGNPRKLRAIWSSQVKTDDRDAEMLARIARLDPQLLHPIRPRAMKTQADLMVLKSRDMLVKTRTTLISHARGLVKSMGQRISGCSPECFHLRLRDEMPSDLGPALDPIGKSIEDLTQRIRHLDKVLEQMSAESHPETQVLRAIPGVGPVTALAFILTLEDSSRFKKSREVGPYIGLTPKRDQSGQVDKQLGITKAGNTYLRCLLVGCAQYIMGAFGPDCELRRFGLKLAARGGKNAKRRAAVAVARKLAIMMHQLWKTGAAYDPFYHENLKKKGKAA